VKRRLLMIAVLMATAGAQDLPPGSKAPSITYFAPEITSVYRGHAADVQLQFRIASGFHINSNRPKQEYLKKTELKFDAPTDIAIVKVSYPEGEDRSFAFDPNEKLSVYTGDFAIGVSVRPLKTVLPAKYAVHGTLKYQACDNAACYPPRQIPVSFEVKVSKDPKANHRRNPGQSPPRHG
jgi:hypothetical protein